MNHITALNELEIIRDSRLNNAAVAHHENRTEDRDRLLTQAHDLIQTIHHLQTTTKTENALAAEAVAVSLAEKLVKH